jgi:hypothetical protein
VHERDRAGEALAVKIRDDVAEAPGLTVDDVTVT